MQHVGTVTTKDILKETVAVVGGNLQSSVKVFKESICNRTTWALTGAIFIVELGVLSYQRFFSNSIDQETYQRRIKASFLSNAVGVVGGSLGVFIGSFIGNLITPGVGGFIGSLIFGLAASVGASMATDMYLDP